MLDLVLGLSTVSVLIYLLVMSPGMHPVCRVGALPPQRPRR